MTFSSLEFFLRHRRSLLAACCFFWPAGVLVASPWDPPKPSADEFDWVQLNSDEWLKGELKGFVKDELYFDSDELGLQKLDRENVKFFRTAGPVRLGYASDGNSRRRGFFKGKQLEVGEGEIELRDGQIRLRNSGRVLTDYEGLVTIASNQETEWDNWSAKVSFGANLREGNTSQVDYAADVRLVRTTPTSMFSLNYLGNYGESQGVEFANNHRAAFSLDLYRSPDFFFSPITGEYFRDPFQNIGHRILVGAGVGYQVLDTPTTNWRLSAGPAYLHTEFETVPMGENKTEKSFAGGFSSRLEIEINDHVDFTSLYRVVVTNEATGLYSHHFANSLSFALMGDLDLDVALIWDRIQEPSTGDNGITPEKDDLRLMLMLGIEL